jgi:phage shock protein PspC (stress-responsive transcriptional regulator)
MITTKKLYRRNGYIGGVCAGLGEWSGIPSILWRILFLFTAGSFWAYLLLWVFVEQKD